MPTYTLVCQHCNQQFALTAPPSTAARQKFCGKKCMSESFKDRIPPLLESLKARLEIRVAQCANGCALYTGQSNGRYGQIEYRRRTYLAHRAAYMVFKGEIPDGMMVCHSCDTPLCINPDHLWIGTSVDNVQDMLQKGRNRYNPRKKITDAQVIDARRRISEGQKHSEIAILLNCSKSYVSMLGSGFRRSEQCSISKIGDHQPVCQT